MPIEASNELSSARKGDMLGEPSTDLSEPSTDLSEPSTDGRSLSCLSAMLSSL
jgi:hypothetical protein